MCVQRVNIIVSLNKLVYHFGVVIALLDISCHNLITLFTLIVATFLHVIDLYNSAQYGLRDDSCGFRKHTRERVSRVDLPTCVCVYLRNYLLSLLFQAGDFVLEFRFCLT